MQSPAPARPQGAAQPAEAAPPEDAERSADTAQPADMAGHGNTAAGSAATGSAPADTVTRGTDTGPRVLRAFTTHPAAGQLTLLLCYLAAGVAVTWPRASYITGTPPRTSGASGGWRGG
jgi:hypothetical protein